MAMIRKSSQKWIMFIHVPWLYEQMVYSVILVGGLEQFFPYIGNNKPN